MGCSLGRCAISPPPCLRAAFPNSEAGYRWCQRRISTRYLRCFSNGCRSRLTMCGQILVESSSLLDYIPLIRGPRDGCPLPARERLARGSCKASPWFLWLARLFGSSRQIAPQDREERQSPADDNKRAGPFDEVTLAILATYAAPKMGVRCPQGRHSTKGSPQKLPFGLSGVARRTAAGCRRLGAMLHRNHKIPPVQAGG